MVVSESTGSSCWHKCTIGADRGGEIFDMLPRRGVGPIVLVPESAVDQFSGLSGARPQSGFAGKVSVLRTPLSSCPGLWPPSAASSGLMHSHQHLLSGGACLYLVARPAHHDRHFLKNEPAPRPPRTSAAQLAAACTAPLCPRCSRAIEASVSAELLPFSAARASKERSQQQSAAPRPGLQTRLSWGQTFFCMKSQAKTKN